MGKVLVLDDNEELAENLGEILEHEGLRVEVRSDPRVALRRMAETVWDVAVLDLRMPWVDGPTVGASLRARQPGTRLIFVTAHADAGLLARARALEPVDVLEKPVGLKNLIDVVRRAVAA
ncbi:MAG: response regulator [Sandaracinaceae bacterium]